MGLKTMAWWLRQQAMNFGAMKLLVETNTSLSAWVEPTQEYLTLTRFNSPYVDMDAAVEKWQLKYV